ncbi:MAG TPA: hypothetical protein VFQ61_25880 [Polyangiaceae bacterium]|nr:hypothetical protein [Polyangiaceae bacterium]
MVFERSTSSFVARSGLAALALLLSCCGRAPRFPLREPLERDPDARPFAPQPAEYYSPFAWDGANQLVFRPISRFFAVDPAGPAANVNALDEVPDSSWFTNRLGAHALTPEDVARGSCPAQSLDPLAPDGAWLIDKGKANGANPGFRIRVEGLGKFMLKSDPPSEPERATGATAIAARIYHAIGYHAACDSVVYFRPEILRLKPGLTVTTNTGVTHPLDREHLNEMLAGASRRNGRVRMVASAWLPGNTIGPYKYDGLRDDDPNDIIPHEDRRELRGARLIAAWLNHFDSREQNTMDTFITPDGAPPGSGYVRHYIIDMGDCFGSVWADDGISRRLGHSYVLDFGYVAEDFVTLGAISRPWERARRTAHVFNYFSARDFDPESWRGEYPNPAFMRMTEADGAWMARILARFTDPLVAAAVRAGQYEPAAERYLTQVLIARRDAILRRYLSRLSPIGDVSLSGSTLCGTDLARNAGVIPNESLSFRVSVYAGAQLAPVRDFRVTSPQPAQLCVEISHRNLPSQISPDDARRYLVVDLDNGYARGPLRVHLYDLGQSRGFSIAGIERPESHDPP